ncbi:PGPGW domain-containing protein [Coraliomargarita sp. W4R53]
MFQELLSEHSDIILLLAGISIAAFVLSIILLPIVIIRLPKDFFIRDRPQGLALSPLKLFLRIAKNLLGLLLLLAGIIMIFIPGQGILTMLFGISLLDFPGKRRLEIKIVRTPRVSRSLNWLRKKADRAPFLLPGDAHAPQE